MRTRILVHPDLRQIRTTLASQLCGSNPHMLRRKQVEAAVPERAVVDADVQPRQCQLTVGGVRPLHADRLVLFGARRQTQRPQIAVADLQSGQLSKTVRSDLSAREHDVRMVVAFVGLTDGRMDRRLDGDAVLVREVLRPDPHQFGSLFAAQFVRQRDFDLARNSCVTADLRCLRRVPECRGVHRPFGSHTLGQEHLHEVHALLRRVVVHFARSLVDEPAGDTISGRSDRRATGGPSNGFDGCMENRHSKYVRPVRHRSLANGVSAYRGSDMAKRVSTTRMCASDKTTLRSVWPADRGLRPSSERKRVRIGCSAPHRSNVRTLLPCCNGLGGTWTARSVR